MINYSEENIFSPKIKKCLSFDPFLTNNNITLSKDKPEPKQRELLLNLKKEYYSCATDCFDLYNNIPIYTYHYHLSCICIKKCYNKEDLF